MFLVLTEELVRVRSGFYDLGGKVEEKGGGGRWLTWAGMVNFYL